MLPELLLFGRQTVSLACVVLQFDADGNGHVTVAELSTVLKELGEPTPAYKIRDMIKEVDLDENGTVEFDEFLAVSEACEDACTCSAAVAVWLRVVHPACTLQPVWIWRCR